MVTGTIAIYSAWHIKKCDVHVFTGCPVIGCPVIFESVSSNHRISKILGETVAVWDFLYEYANGLQATLIHTQSHAEVIYKCKYQNVL